MQKKLFVCNGILAVQAKYYQWCYNLLCTLFVYGVVNIGCILFKAITYLQSAYRLKGEDAVEADDITEIAGVYEQAHFGCCS